MFKILLLFVLCVLCVVNTQSDDGYNHSRSYTRVKRGKYYPGPPLRFHSRPPSTFPIKGPFSYTPPPFMAADEPPYPGSRPNKVSKRPNNEGLGDEDINNLVRHLSKQDLDKILEFAYGKSRYSEKSNAIDYRYNPPHKRENSYRPSYTKDIYMGNMDTKYQEEKPYEVEFKKFINFVTEPTPVKLQNDRSPFSADTEIKQVNVYGLQDDRSTQYQSYAVQDEKPNLVKVYTSQNDQTFPADVLSHTEHSLNIQAFDNPQASSSYPLSSNSYIPENNDEETLPPPINMREEDFDVSYTNNVPTIVEADSLSYKVENFGELPLMNYNSKLHSVSSYHVPHYTVTQSKSQSQVLPASSSSSVLKPSPAAASIKAPPFEPAPPVSTAKQQSDAHLKATKIWSHRSKGAAYTLHDDGTLTPERSRPKYG